MLRASNCNNNPYKYKVVSENSENAKFDIHIALNSKNNLSSARNSCHRSQVILMKADGETK